MGRIIIPRRRTVPRPQTGLTFPHADREYWWRDSYTPPATWASLHNWVLVDRPPFVPRAVAPRPVLQCRVNHGHWIVDCPFCLGAQLACFSQPLFFCELCLCIKADGKWLRVAWPHDPHGIERALSGRPKKNRNWFPWETIADLYRENRDKGID